MLKGIPYRSGSDLTPYMHEKCRLDVYLPQNRKEGFGTVIYLHAGGLKAGNRNVPRQIRGKDYAVVSASYRLHPKVRSPAYIEDAAAAVAWVFENIESYGGDPDRIVLVGFSAGGYLASLITLDKSWLRPYDIDPDSLLGLASISGQSITHFTVRKEMGIAATKPLINEFAPLYHVRGDAPPILLTTGDRELELFGRYEETSYYNRMLKSVGHKQVSQHEFKGATHSDVERESYPVLREFIAKCLSDKIEERVPVIYVK